ncbi:hypothetical protein LXL04_038015 [Taraxacum kok-saghyz]
MYFIVGDVLHNWVVPSSGVKCDAVPDRLNQTSISVQREGVYYVVVDRFAFVAIPNADVLTFSSLWMSRGASSNYQLSCLTALFSSLDRGQIYQLFSPYPFPLLDAYGAREHLLHPEMHTTPIKVNIYVRTGNIERTLDSRPLRSDVERERVGLFDCTSDHRLGLGPRTRSGVCAFDSGPRTRSDILPQTRSGDKNRRLIFLPLMSDSVRSPRCLVGAFDVGLGPDSLTSNSVRADSVYNY